MSFDIGNTLAGFQKLKQNIITTTGDLSRGGSDMMIEDAKDATPVKTGHLKSSIYAFESRRDGYIWTVKFAPHTIYARQRELGGVLVPKTQPYMRFFWEKLGRWVKFTRVEQQGAHYMLIGISVAKAAMGDYLAGGWGKGMKI